jgi:hypothetical protein
MAKFNWDRVRFENRSRRYGTENVKTGHRSDPDNNISIPYDVPAKKKSVGDIITKSSSSKSSESISKITILCPVGRNDNRVRLPKSAFQGGLYCFVDGKRFLSQKSDQDRSTKVDPKVFGARPGDRIILTRQTANRWKSHVERDRIEKKTLPRIRADRSSRNSKNAFLDSPPVINPSPFDDAELRDWLFSKCGSVLDDVSVEGSGPFDEDEFEDFLKSIDVNVKPISERTEILIVGRDDWFEATLDKLLNLRARQPTRIYSQEMYLAYCLTGLDPLEEPDVAQRFAGDHPALEYLSTIGFSWVNTFAAPGDGSFDEELPDVGMLKHYGYKVGNYGRDKSSRHKILHLVFNSTLSVVVSEEYTQKWGVRASKERLQKMANSLATFCRNEKRKRNPSMTAIEEWENDLQWLCLHYYSGKFSFQWPST